MEWNECGAVYANAVFVRSDETMVHHYCNFVKSVKYLLQMVVKL